MKTLWQDARYLIRLLTKTPGTVALALVLGIGASAAIFSLANITLPQPAHGIASSDRLVRFEPVIHQGEISPTLRSRNFAYRFNEPRDFFIRRVTSRARSHESFVGYSQSLYDRRSIKISMRGEYASLDQGPADFYRRAIFYNERDSRRSPCTGRRPKQLDAFD